MKNLLLLIVATITITSCSQPHKAKNVERAFYFWKSDSYRLYGEDSILKSVKANKLYVKFFEVEKNSTLGNIPFAKTQLSLGPEDKYVIVPTVYLKNEVFLNVSKGAIDTLADNVNFLIAKYAKEKLSVHADQIAEFQMDCDWTPKSKDNYFYFLGKLKTISNKIISCTLRLYPYKYPDKMGVPPVDKAMLMCYNLSHPLSDKNSNSILDLKELKSYLNTSKKYPLHLDVALPVYSWVHLYQNNKFTSIMHHSFKPDATFINKSPMWYQSTRDTLIGDHYIRKGDMLKFEDITSQDIKQATDIIKKYVAIDADITVSLFHLDNSQLNRFTHEEISDFYSAFTK